MHILANKSEGTWTWLECPNFMPVQEGELWI